MTNQNNNEQQNPSVAITKTGLGQEMVVQHETASAAIAARTRAQIEARAIMAMQRPRNWDDVRTRLLKECKRPGFAKAARYRKPVGQGIEGPSIRFAEAALRYMTNVAIETTVIYDDPQKEVLRVSVADLEANVPYETEVIVQKTVERRKLGRGQIPIATRANSFGDTVYIVSATDDECLNRTNALVSKALRTLALRLLPGDILDECMAMCIRVAEDEDAKDPNAARKQLVDAFFDIGVTATQLQNYIGHALDTLAPAELTRLRAVYAAIRDGETTWQEVAEEDGAAEAPAEKKPNKASEIVERYKDSKKKPEPAAPAADPAADPDNDGR